MALTKITTSVIAANTLSTANIADNSIDATKIASNSILTRHIDDDQVTGDQLADTISIVTDLNVGNDLAVTGNTTITGNLTVNGSTVTNSSTNTTIEDALIELGTGTSGSPSTDAGIVIERGSSDNVFIGWDESADKVTVGTGSFTGASSGNLTITPAAFVSGALTASGLAYPTSDGSANQVIQTDGSGNLSFGNKASSSQVDTYATSGDGSTTAFDTGTNPLDEKNTWVFIDGVYQQKSTYSYSGSTITFATAPDNGAAIDVITGTTDSMSSSDTVLGVYEATTTATTTYTTGLSASNENNTWVFVGGVLQPKDSYTFSSGTLTFDAATPAGEKLSVTATRALTAGSVVTASIGANAVTSAKIASNSILSRHIANNSIVGADISATTGITASTFTGALTGNVTGNVTGNLTGTIQTAAQTNITSVGTLSALTVSGDLTVDTSTLKVDSTNNRVGVGLTSPSVPIHIQDQASSDTTVLRLENKPATAATNHVAMEFWGNEGTANNGVYNIGRIYGHFDGSNYSDTRLTLGSASGGGSFNDELSLKNAKVGIGTSSPSHKLDVSGTIRANTNDALRISNYNTIGQTVSGAMHIIGHNAVVDSSTANKVVAMHTSWYPSFIKMYYNHGITFHTSNSFYSVGDTLLSGTGANSLERMRIDTSGRFLFNTTTASTAFTIQGDTTADVMTVRTGATTNNNVGAIVFRDGASEYCGQIVVNGQNNTVGYVTSSDYRLKENVIYDWDATTRLKQLKPSRFNWISDPTDTLVDGFLAHEVSNIVPEAVTGEKNGIDEDGNPVYQGIDQAKLVPLLVKAMQEQQTIIDDLKSRVETLENN